MEITHIPLCRDRQLPIGRLPQHEKFCIQKPCPIPFHRWTAWGIFLTNAAQYGLVLLFLRSGAALLCAKQFIPVCLILLLERQELIGYL